MQEWAQELSSLRFLSVSNAFESVLSDVIAVVKRGHPLECLEILYPMLVDAELASFVRHLKETGKVGNLSSLLLRGAPLGVNTLSVLGQLIGECRETLNSLRIDSCEEASDNDISRLMKSTRVLHYNLSDLTLSHGLCGSQFVDSLAQAANELTISNRFPFSLDMRGSIVSRSGCAGLSIVMQSLFPLVHLNLDDNPIHNDGAMQIANGLLSPLCQLQSLSLRNCGIKCTGGTLIVSALAQNKSLTRLDLSHNVLNHDHSHSFGISCGEALAINSTLLDLDLSHTLLYALPEALTAGLEVNKTLKSLQVNGNRLQSIGVLTISQILAANDALESLGLSGNLISDEDLSILSLSLINRASRLSKPLQRLDIRSNAFLRDSPFIYDLQLVTNSLLYRTSQDSFICDGLQEI